MNAEERDMSAMEDYLGRVMATLWHAADFVSPEGIARAREHIHHGEPAEGMRTLAWMICEESVMVPRTIIDEIREHSADLVPEEFMPENLDRYAIEIDQVADDAPDAES